MLEVMLVTGLRDLVNVLFGVSILAGVFHLFIKMIGLKYAEIMDKLDDNPLAIAIFVSAALYSISSVISAVCH